MVAARETYVLPPYWAWREVVLVRRPLSFPLPVLKIEEQRTSRFRELGIILIYVSGVLW